MMLVGILTNPPGNTVNDAVPTEGGVCASAALPCIVYEAAMPRLISAARRNSTLIEFFNEPMIKSPKVLANQ